MNKKFSWKDFAIVFQHYIKKEMKSRAYIIVTVILCIASIASCFIVDGIVNGQEKEELRIIDKTGIFAGYLVSDSVDEDYFTGVKPVLSDDTSISKEDMLTDIEENGGAYAVFSKDGDDVKLTVYNNGDLSAADQTALINLTQNIYTQMNIGRLGISPEMFEEASRQIGFERNYASRQTSEFLDYLYTVHADGTGYRNVFKLIRDRSGRIEDKQSYGNSYDIHKTAAFLYGSYDSNRPERSDTAFSRGDMLWRFI